MSRSLEIIQTHQSGELRDEDLNYVAVVKQTITKMVLPEADEAEYNIEGIGQMVVAMKNLNTRGEMVEVEHKYGYWTRYDERLIVKGDIVGGVISVDLHHGQGETQLTEDTVVKARDDRWQSKMEQEEWRRDHPGGNWI